MQHVREIYQMKRMKWPLTLQHSVNANPGAYKVFRNVKDYGAKGE